MSQNKMVHKLRLECFNRQRLGGRLCRVLLLILAASLGFARPAAAQGKAGFEQVAKAVVGGEELLSQPELWVYETHLKKMRMLRLDTRDPATGKVSSNLYWYLVFKVVNRDLGRPVDNTDTTPVNTEDVQPPEMFIPEILLVTNDEGGPKVYRDVIRPDVQAAIARREELDLKNPVQMVSSVLAVSPEGQEDAVQYGVAIWENVDSRTDFFSVFLGGFSNGYRIGMGPDGKPVRFRKTIHQEFWRPGDELEENEAEMRFKGEPQWIYRIDAPRQVDLPIEEPASVTAGNEN